MKFDLSKRKILGALAASIVLAGCTVIPYAQVGDPDFGKITSFAAEPDAGVIYVLRTRESDYQGHELTVNFNDKKVSTGSKTYTRVVLKPGAYNLEPNIPGLFSFEEELDLNLKAGEVVFVRFDAYHRIGIPNKGSIVNISPETAKAAITEQKLMPARTQNLM